MALSDEQLRECHRQLKSSEGKDSYPKIEKVADIEKPYQWLEKASLKDSTEAQTMVAQDQALRNICSHPEVV